MARNPIIREPYDKVPTDHESPHGCIDGWVYLGFEGEDSEALSPGPHLRQRLPKFPGARTGLYSPDRSGA